MKNIKLLILGLIIYTNTSLANTLKPRSSNDLKGTITISGAFALYPITVKWAEEFKKKNPQVKFEITAGGAGKGINDALAGLADIGLVSRDLSTDEVKKGAFPYAVTKDAVIPTINAQHPQLKELLSKGLKKSTLNEIFISGRVRNWGQALGLKSGTPIHIYTRSDAAGAAESWAKYFGKKQEDLQGVGVYGDPGLALAIKKDPLGIGYNNIVYIYDNKSRKADHGVIPLPIDLNNNGKIDSNEQLYDTIEKLIEAIANGVYPSPPARELYFVTKGKSQNQAVKEFIKYVLNEGQGFVQESGYVSLSKDRINKEKQKLN